MTEPVVYKPRRTAKSDPQLGQHSLFSPKINQQLADGLPPETRRRYFTRATMPAHWLEAILENQPSYRKREKSVALNFEDLPDAMAVEFVWAIERQVQLGMRVPAQHTSKLTRQLALVVADAQHAHVASLVDLPREEWMRAIRKLRTRRGDPLAPGQLLALDHLLGRFLDLLAHVYHQGEWWELNVWNPLLDTRIPLREHEPLRTNLIYFSHLTTPWLREAVKWWLSRQLERGVYTWSTAQTRQHGLAWFQRYVDRTGCDGPQLSDDQHDLGRWVQGFRHWLGKQKATTGPNRGSSLGATQVRAALTAPEQLYRFLFHEQKAAAQALGEPRWLRLGLQHAMLFRFGEKPTGPKAPPAEAVLSDTVISRIAEHSELLAVPKAEGGFGEEQLVRVLGLLIRTGRRVPGDHHAGL